MWDHDSTWRTNFGIGCTQFEPFGKMSVHIRYFRRMPQCLRQLLRLDYASSGCPCSARISVSLGFMTALQPPLLCMPIRGDINIYQSCTHGILRWANDGHDREIEGLEKHCESRFSHIGRRRDVGSSLHVEVSLALKSVPPCRYFQNFQSVPVSCRPESEHRRCLISVFYMIPCEPGEA